MILQKVLSIKLGTGYAPAICTCVRAHARVCLGVCVCGGGVRVCVGGGGGGVCGGGGVHACVCVCAYMVSNSCVRAYMHVSVCLSFLVYVGSVYFVEALFIAVSMVLATLLCFFLNFMNVLQLQIYKPLFLNIKYG